MKKTVSVMLALFMLSLPALAERYASAFGYSMELPEGWLPLNRDTYPVIAAALGEKQLSAMGLTGEMAGSMIDVMAEIGMEYLFSGDGLANASVTVVRQEPTPERLAQSAEIAKQTYGQNGATDAMTGPAKFGENEFRAAACTLKGQVIASYFCGAGDALFSLVFTNASAADISLMLSEAVFSPGETAPEGTGGPGGAVFSMNGAASEPLG